MITPSSLARLAACPASGALPEVRVESPEMRRGSVVHAYLDRCADGDRNAALAAVPPEHRDFCASIDLARLPYDPTAASIMTEPAYAYNLSSDSSRYLGRRLGRRYGSVGAMEIAGSMDVVEFALDRIAVWDYKVGFGSNILAPPPARNLQLRTYALMVARSKRATSATIGRIRIDEDARVWVDEPVELDAFDIDEIADEVRSIHARVQAAREEVLTGRQPSVTVSEHCTYCPAFQACPAQTALVRQLAADPEEVERYVAANLTPENAARAWERIKQVEEVAARARKAVEDYARRTPIDLGNGRVLALTQTTRESIDGDAAYVVLRDSFGEEVAAAACRLSTSKTALKDAIKAYALRVGRPPAEMERQALSMLREAGAINETTTETVRETKAK